MDSHEDRLVGTVVGNFRLLRKIGEGGMGSVYLAERVADFQQMVALKLLLEGLHLESTRARFLIEQQALASLQHRHIVQIVDSGLSDDGIPFLAMEFVDGVPIDEYANARQLSVEGRLRLFLQVLDAVEFAHQRFLVHCDLKFSNIFVNNEGNAQLLDFGVAKLLRPEMLGLAGGATRATLRPFTPEFASPEQLQARTLTTATDIYSAGVVLHTLLCGAHPQEEHRSDPVKLLRAICGDEPELMSQRVRRMARANPAFSGEIASARRTTPQELAVRLAGDLDAIVAKALHKDPERRYSVASAFADDLRRVLSYQPVGARRQTLRYQASRFVARNRATVVAVAMVLLLVGAGLGSWLWQAWRTRISREKAIARFSDTRQLTNTLLFDFYDVVAQLPGATPAQEMLVRWSLQNLDELSRQQNADPSLAIEMAEGYRKLGELLGNPFFNNLGKPDEAVTTLSKGLVLLEPFVGSPVDSTAPRGHRDATLAMARIYRSRSQVHWMTSQTEPCLRDAEDSLSLFESLAARYPRDYEVQMETAAKHESHADLYAGAYYLVADVERARKHLEQAQEFAKRAIAADPTQVRPYRGLAIFQMKIADLLADTDPAASIPVFLEAEELLKDVPAEGRKEAATKRVERVIAFRAAWSYSAIGQYEEAIRLYDSVLEEHEDAVRLDPTNELVQWDLAVLLKEMAEARRFAGKHEEALHYYNRCVKLIQDFYDDSLGGERRAAYGEALIQQGITLSELGRIDEAALATRNGLRILEEEISGEEASASLLQRAAGLFLVAKPEQLRRPRKALTLLDQLMEDDDENSILITRRAEALAQLGQIPEAVRLAKRAATLTSAKENVNEWNRIQAVIARQ